MPAILVRNVSEDLVDALERRAKRNDRSLQKEVHHILRSIAEAEPPAEPLPALKLEMSSVTPDSTWSRDEIYGDDGR